MVLKNKMERDKTDLKETEEEEEIKSNAVVKLSVGKNAQFTKLKCNTDLNLPPSNWLSSSADSYGLQHVLYNQKGFSSFQMAHMFPDCVGEVDVVSDAENIKKLLKIPYCKSHVSMMVHRVENTLLLDDFDIYKYLLRTSEFEWKWLREFFFENVNHETCEEDRNLYIKSRRREALKRKSLVSKFLYHSLVENDNNNNSNDTDNDMKNNTNMPIQVHQEWPLLPEAHPETPDPNKHDHKYNRNVLWTFEDIEMLIGTDLPIFGGGTHPCISLRLRDVSKPINVLTGIDYWLDNLMCNVPEVVMCYHLNGIVQKYELIKTEDLPHLDNSKFSPKLIRDVAQCILSFLKSNATKAGHTYWLFKGKDEEVVKLYDLTSLCTEKDVENDHNPFIIPVAMLLYRVARNMKHSKHTTNRQPGTIRMLLKNCIKLLPEEKYPEIVTSSHYMLSDLYVPADTNPENPIFEPQDCDDSESIYDDDLNYACNYDVDDDDVDDRDSATKILVLDQHHVYEKQIKQQKPPPPITGSVEERCLQAIQHITSGLKCLKYFINHNNESSNKENINRNNNDGEEEIKMAKPFEAIPMGYSKIEKNTDKESQQNQKRNKKRNKKKNNHNITDDSNDNALLLRNHQEQSSKILSLHQQNENISWKDHLKTLLYEKAVLVYATLAEQNYVNRNYGNCLRTIELLARCQLIINKLLYTSNSLKETCLLGRAGDCCIMMVQNWNKIDSYREQFHNKIDEELRMIEQLEQDEQYFNINIGETNMKCVFIYDIRTIEQMLLKGVECYDEALKLNRNDDNILRRQGNSLNEIASFYLNKAKMNKTKDIIIEMCLKAEPYLHRGLLIFEKIKDDANTALLYTNLGHMHRLLAHAHTPDDRQELTDNEKFHYNKAFNNYKRALQVLGDRKHNPQIWDAVKWELSTALFNMGWIMHENPPSNCSKSEAEKQVIETLQRALQYCDCDEDNPKYPLYQYRSAMIHFRIGSLYHSHIWSTQISDQVNRKNIIQLAKINYEKASKLYHRVCDVFGYFTSQMQRLALLEYLVETGSVPNAKVKTLQQCLDIFTEMDDMLLLIIDKKVDLPDSENDNNNLSNSDDFKTCYSLLKLVKQRLQYILKNLIKLCLTKPPPNKDCPKLINIYKDLYKLSLNINETTSCLQLVQDLHRVIKQIIIKTTDTDTVN